MKGFSFINGIIRFEGFVVGCFVWIRITVWVGWIGVFDRVGG